MLKQIRLFGVIIVSLILVGCSNVRPDGQARNPDPLEPINRPIFAFNTKADEWVIKPITKGYRKITPKPVRQGIRNFYTNLDYVPTFANDVFQLNLTKALKTLGGFIFNTTIGIGGILNIAKPAGLESEYNSFGDTLRHYGMEYSPYLVLPILGSSTIRDAAGMYADHRMGLPHIFRNDEPLKNHRFYNLFYAFSGLQLRESYLDRDSVIDEMSVYDRYIFFRNAYLQQRNSNKTGDTDNKDEFIEDDY